jgi:hypothetical protein
MLAHHLSKEIAHCLPFFAPGSQFMRPRGTASPSEGILPTRARGARVSFFGGHRLNLILILILLLVLFGGGGFYVGGPYVGGGLGTILLIILIIVIVRGI